MSTATEPASAERPAPLSILADMRETLGELGVPAPVSSGRRDPFAVLVATVVSLRTRDAVTRQVSRRLLQRAPDPAELARMETGELEELLRPAGFFRQKARQLKKTAERLLEDHDGRVPDTRPQLTALPGVGPKTASYVLGIAFRKPAICVDVHVHRIAGRMGLVDAGDPEETRRGLEALFPRDHWIGINHVFVRYGQRICRPRKPSCGACPFTGWCPSAEVHS